MRGKLHPYRTAAACLLLLAAVLILRLPVTTAEALPLPAGHGAGGSELAIPAQFFVPYYAPAPRVERRRTYRRRYRKKPSRRHVVVPKCEPPWSYSQGLRKCICVAEGYGLSEGKCVKLAELCAGSGEWSEKSQSCRCDDDHVLKDGQCVAPKIARSALQSIPGAKCFWPRVPGDDNAETCNCAPGYKLEEESGLCQGENGEDINARQEAARAGGLLTRDVALIQQCMKEAGYLRGDIAARMTKRAWTAFWFFKQDHKVGSTPKGVHEVRAQKMLFELCPLAARAVKGTELAALRAMRDAKKKQQEDAGGVLKADENRPPPRTVYAKPEATCLPEKLLRLVTRSYGKRPGLKQCTQTCVAVPKGISDREIALLERRGVKWCRDCLEISTHMPLSDILRIERASSIQICTRPAPRLPRWQGADGAPGVAYTKVRKLYRTLPTATQHSKDIAVVIGNKNYQGGLPANESAHNDAGAIYALLTEHLGYSQANIIDLRDATLEDMTRVFGGPEGQGELARRLAAAKEAGVLIYYAGHGATNLERTESYLLPVDAVEHRENRSAYPMSQLYANIEKLGGRPVMLFLEAGFGRDQSDFVYAPNLPELATRSLPARDIKGLTVMSAADKDQRTMDDPEFGIGLFTRYLIEGLAGRADLAPIGDNDLKIDAVELYAYTARMVDLAARKSYGMLQEPMMSGSGNEPVSTVQAQLQ